MLELRLWKICAGLLLAPLVVGVSCAEQPLPGPAKVAPPVTVTPLPDLPRSSIAAVVLHRQELGLTEDQVRDLELRDLDRQKEDAALREEIEQERKKATDARSAASNGGGAGNSAAGMRGGGSGGGMHGGGGMRGGGMGGGGMRAGAGRNGGGHANSPAQEASSVSLEDRLDANDTKAYLDAEGLLADTQRDRARDIASDFREKLYERRELLRTPAGAAK